MKMTEHERRFALLMRLNDIPVEQWRLDEDAAVTIAGALSAPASAPEELVDEMSRLVEHMKQSSDLVEHEYRRLRRTHRITLGLNFVVSAMFFGSFLNSGRLVELLCSVVWLVGPIALGFLHRRGTKA